MEEQMSILQKKSSLIQDWIIRSALEYGPKLILAILFLIFGWIAIKFVIKTLKKTISKAGVDASLQTFLVSLVSMLLKILLVVSAASMVGIKTTSFVALLGAAGLAVGLALQGSLSNFAGGVLILFFKPFRVGDFISAQGIEGTVREIHVFHTVVIQADGKKAILPNGDLSNGVIENFTSEPTRRCDFVFGIGYSSDIALAKAQIQNIIDADSRVLKNPAPLVAVSEHGASSVNLEVRVWCKPEDYLATRFHYPEKVKLAFDQAGIEIPFPQMDVLIKPGSSKPF
ncbi:MAG: mechanosensitive ion channel [Bdellovibrionota bacterium]